MIKKGGRTVIEKICENCKYYPDKCRAYSEGYPDPYDCCEEWQPKEELVLGEIWKKLLEIETIVNNNNLFLLIISSVVLTMFIWFMLLNFF